MVAIFVKKEDSRKAEALLESAGFQQSPIPPGTGAVTDLLSEIRNEKDRTVDEKLDLKGFESWSQSHGEIRYAAWRSWRGITRF